MQALSGSVTYSEVSGVNRGIRESKVENITFLPGRTWVAPMLVMKGQPPGNDGLKIFPLSVWLPSGFKHVSPLPATPKSPEE